MKKSFDSACCNDDRLAVATPGSVAYNLSQGKFRGEREQLILGLQQRGPSLGLPTP